MINENNVLTQVQDGHEEFALAQVAPELLDKIKHIYRETLRYPNVAEGVTVVAPRVFETFSASRQWFALLDTPKTVLTGMMCFDHRNAIEIKLPVGTNSLSGFAVATKQAVSVLNAHDAAALQRIHPQLSHMAVLDEKLKVPTGAVLACPVQVAGQIYGVLEVANPKTTAANSGFSDEDFLAAKVLARWLAARVHEQKTGERIEVEGSVINEFHRPEAPVVIPRPVAPVKMPVAHAPEPAPAPAAPAAPQVTGKYAALINLTKLQPKDLLQVIEQSKGDPALEKALMQQHKVTAAQIGSALSQYYKVPYEPQRARRNPNKQVLSRLKREQVFKFGWLPLDEVAGNLVVMCLDPAAARTSKELMQNFPRNGKYEFRVTAFEEFQATVDQVMGKGEATIDQLLAEMGGGDAHDEEEDIRPAENADNEVVKFVNKMILDAYSRQASDIHIEPLPGKLKTGIRFRIDGSLIPYVEVPAGYRQALVARLKIMADLDIAESRRPQDGKITFKKFGPLDIELRVATLPTTNGLEDVVMRILAGGEPIPMEKLGLTDHNMHQLRGVITKPYGLFYVCGPTGSGKTTTLHSILSFLNTSDTKIWTAEDPVEITQKGLRQVQVNKKAGITFAMLMRAFLRADPDIIVVGESRDEETVSTGVEASLTGHLVFSTLHTNSAPESITRLLDMGMDPFNFADALLGILAQRLAKRLCSCKEAYTPSQNEMRTLLNEYSYELRTTTLWKADPEGQMHALEEGFAKTYGQHGQYTLYKAVGCEQCMNTGYKGRLGLHELLIANDSVKALVQNRARVSEVTAAAIEGGMRTLKMDGIEKVLQGHTDMKQVRAVCIK